MQPVATNVSGQRGMAMFSVIVAMVHNRTGGDYTRVFNSVLRENRDLMTGRYDNMDAAQSFGRLLNRVESRSGLSPIAVTERCSDEIAALTNRFAPQFMRMPTAFQWEVLSRAAKQLEIAGLPVKMFNRAPQNVSDSDWNAANNQADGVLDFLVHRTETIPNDVGEGLKAKGAGARQIWLTFYAQVKRLMTDNGLSCQQAFEKLKEEQPLFWTMALLSFEKGVPTK
jgi:hypothetical protein